MVRLLKWSSMPAEMRAQLGDQILSGDYGDIFAPGFDYYLHFDVMALRNSHDYWKEWFPLKHFKHNVKNLVNRLIAELPALEDPYVDVEEESVDELNSHDNDDDDASYVFVEFPNGN